MLTLGQKLLAFGTLALVFLVSLYFTGILAVLLVPITVVVALALRRL